MKTKLVVAILLSLGVPGLAHRLDEYLQAAIISLEGDRVQVYMRLIPGVAVSSTVLASIDTDANGIISETERRAYAERVLLDLSLNMNGSRLVPRLVSVNFPPIQEIKEGLGEIQIEFGADLPRSHTTSRKLVFENHHQSPISAYLVNCLVPRDQSTRIVTQNRNENQSFYQLDFMQADAGHSDPLPLMVVRCPRNARHCRRFRQHISSWYPAHCGRH